MAVSAFPEGWRRLSSGQGNWTSGGGVGWALVLWGSPQEHGSIYSLDHIGKSWYLGHGGGLALKIEGQARSSGIKLWMWEGCPRELEDSWGKLGGWASS